MGWRCRKHEKKKKEEEDWELLFTSHFKIRRNVEGKIKLNELVEPMVSKVPVKPRLAG